MLYGTRYKFQRVLFFKQVTVCATLKQVDIELPEELPLKEAHVIGETLQNKIEKLTEVERAFVHLDFECDHKPEHMVLSRLPGNDP